MRDIQELLRTGDAFAAIEQIQRQGSPEQIAERYQSLVVDLYWKSRDLPAVVLVSRAGITWCLAHSLAAETSHSLAGHLRSAAKALAYNAGSFTWPAWQEPGINPTPDEIAFGRDCARLNMRLAAELEKPPKAMANAHWLLGAHALSAGEFESAEKEFETARDVLPAISPETTAMHLCNTGYIAIAQLCKNAGDSMADKSFDETLALLTAEKSDDSREFVGQLQSIRQFFLRRS
jgi:hypothetical protein